MIVEHPVITGSKVTLRPYTAGFSEVELRALYRWGVDKQIIDLSGGSPLEMPFDRFREVFLHQLPRRNGGQQQLFAILDEEGDMIGRIGLFAFDEDGGAELGIVIGERDRWNQGYGRDAVRTLCRHAFATMGLTHVVLYTFVDNERAQRAFSACGFQSVRELRRFSFERGLHTELEMMVSKDSLSPEGAR